MARAEVDPARVIGVGVVSAAGNGEASALEALVDLPVQADTLINAAASYEHGCGAARGIRDVLYIHAAEQIGLGIVAAGRCSRRDRERRPTRP